MLECVGVCYNIRVRYSVLECVIMRVLATPLTGVSVARCAIKSRTGAPFGDRARLVFVVRAGAPFGAPFSHLCAGMARLSIFGLFYRRFAKF